MAAIELKLKYCPKCGTAVKLHYGRGLLYQCITWRCTSRYCPMSHMSWPLDGWNERGKPRTKSYLLEAWKEMRWKIKRLIDEKI